MQSDARAADRQHLAAARPLRRRRAGAAARRGPARARPRGRGARAQAATAATARAGRRSSSRSPSSVRHCAGSRPSVRTSSSCTNPTAACWPCALPGGHASRSARCWSRSCRSATSRSAAPCARSAMATKCSASRESVERRFRRFKAPLQIFLGRRTARAADLVLAPSATTAAELARDYGARKTAVLPNASGGLVARPEAVCGESWESTRPACPACSSSAGCACARASRCSCGRSRCCAPRATRRDPRACASRETASTAQAIERAAVRFGVRDQVDFLGRRGPAEVRWLLEHSAALVVPSIYEGMPLVILEAMLAGLPVIASRVSGIPEVVLDPETGWLVHSRGSAGARGGHRGAARRSGGGAPPRRERASATRGEISSGSGGGDLGVDRRRRSRRAQRSRTPERGSDRSQG